MFDCTRHAQDQANHLSSMNVGGANVAISLAEKLLAVDGYWESEGHLSSVRFLVGCPCSCDCPHLLHTGIRPGGLLLNGFEVSWEWMCWRDHENLEGGMGMDSTKIYHTQL